MRIDHIPVGNPCKKCNQSAFIHRVEHVPEGNPCARCGLPDSLHRVRKRKQPSKQDWRYVGVDGEGLDRDINGKTDHQYVLLTCVAEDGQTWAKEDFSGQLSTKQCLEFLLTMPTHNIRMFAYSFNYDLTKILKDLPDDKLYELARPKLRERRGKERIKGPRPVKWEGYRLNLQGTKFTIATRFRRRVIWDIWKFFQGKFVTALQDWKIGTPELHERMQRMKDKRSVLNQEKPEDVKRYCAEECLCMSHLGRKLVAAHEAIGLELRSFYGAGSTSGALLKKMNILEQLRPPIPEMYEAVSVAFAGGRFESSIVGRVLGRVWNYDISGAYVYQLCFLPCLVHGTWKRVTHWKDLKGVEVACVKYRLPKPKFETPLFESWGPFPFRTKDGSICFPSSSGGGWVWLEEYLAGEKLFPHVEFLEAWVYEKQCDCNPFVEIPSYYLERLRIGKEGPGIVLKLGCNAVYGKLAQSLGNAIFNNWIWAGIITSATRAQILQLIGIHKDPRKLLTIATDGIQTLERLKRPAPKDTGTDKDVTDESSNESVRKPLGGWEEEYIDGGVFYARPGIFFPILSSKKEKKKLKEIRARGIGKGVLLENRLKVVECWEECPKFDTKYLIKVRRFCGFKSSITRSGKKGAYTYTRSPNYGQWIERDMVMTFNPDPKRETIRPDSSLSLRSFPMTMTSEPYDPSIKSLEARELMAAQAEIEEQPDFDYEDYQDSEF